MVEVFVTSIRNEMQAERILDVLQSGFPGLLVNIDLSDSAADFPCDHTILRVEGDIFQTESINVAVNEAGVMCNVLEDKICK
jgi:hypothetical protein